MNDDFDDDIRARQDAMSVLEDENDPLSERRQRFVTDDPRVFAPDDLDRASQLAQQFQGKYTGLDGKVALRDQRWLDLVQTAPFTRIQPPTVLQGVIGGQQPVTSVPANITNAGILSGPAVQVANWGGNDAETVPITVTIAPVQQVGDRTQPFGLRPYAIVQFGTRGFLVQAEVDIGTGAQFTVSGSSVTVQAALELPLNGVPSTENMILAGMLSFYAIVRTSPLTRTRYADNLTLRNTFIIPPFSKNLTWLPNDIVTVAAATTLTFRDSQTNITHSALLPADSLPAVIPLADDDVTVVVDNPTAGKSGRLVFGLSI